MSCRWPVMIAFEHKARREGRVVLDHNPAAKVKRADSFKADVAVLANVGTADLIEQLREDRHLSWLDPSDDGERGLLGVGAVRGSCMVHIFARPGRSLRQGRS